MSGKTVTFANRQVNSYLGGPTVARPPTLYLQPTSTTPTASVAGTPLLSRIAIPNDPSHFPAAVAGATSNGATVALGATSGLTLSPMLGAELWDALTGGQRSYWGTIASTDISDRAAVNFAPGALVFSEA